MSLSSEGIVSFWLNIFPRFNRFWPTLPIISLRAIVSMISSSGMRVLFWTFIGYCMLFLDDLMSWWMFEWSSGALARAQKLLIWCKFQMKSSPFSHIIFYLLLIYHWSFLQCDSKTSKGMHQISPSCFRWSCVWASAALAKYLGPQTLQTYN